MKCVMIFLVLSLVVLMAEPGEGFLHSLWRAGKSMFKGARQGFRGTRVLENGINIYFNKSCILQLHPMRPPHQQYFTEQIAINC
uniref:Uncharacterized protein n=1 Tax=Poecilia reticulata TaxID=8081 RepID=A0A3P9PT99_POERE